MSFSLLSPYAGTCCGDVTAANMSYKVMGGAQGGPGRADGGMETDLRLYVRRLKNRIRSCHNKDSEAEFRTTRRLHGCMFLAAKHTLWVVVEATVGILRTPATWCSPAALVQTPEAATASCWCRKSSTSWIWQPPTPLLAPQDFEPELLDECWYRRAQQSRPCAALCSLTALVLTPEAATVTCWI